MNHPSSGWSFGWLLSCSIHSLMYGEQCRIETPANSHAFRKRTPSISTRSSSPRSNVTRAPPRSTSDFNSSIDEVLNQQRNISYSLAQCRHLDRNDIQPVQEILAKLAFGNKRVQIAMRGCNHSHVDRNWPAAANAFDFTFLQNSQ